MNDQEEKREKAFKELMTKKGQLDEKSFVRLLADFSGEKYIKDEFKHYLI